jgi:cytochrome d ubiquinol oxidase subunit I
MDPVGASRLLFGTSLAVHIVYATLGVGLPGLIAVAEALGLRRRDPLWALLARRWAAVFSVFLATGVVTGTIVALQLQLLWPAFVRLAGQVIALPFAMEVFAFFVEAVFTVIYLHAAERIPPALRLVSAVLVALGAAASALLITDVNAFMNTPVGFRLADGRLTDVHPWRAMLSPAMPSELAHVLVTAYLAVALVLGAFAAAALRRGGTPAERAYHRRELDLAMAVAAVSAVLTAVTGDWSGKFLAAVQPEKFAAAEGLFRTSAPAPLTVGGIADPVTGVVRGGLEIPRLLSWLATGRWDGRVLGLEAFPRDLWPPVAVTHLLFDAMVLVGGLALLLPAAWWLWRLGGRSEPPGWLLAFAVAMGPVGMAGIETGWLFAELARQPWTVVGVLTTPQAATANPHAAAFVAPFLGLFALLAAGSALAVHVHRRTHPLGPALAALQGGGGDA